MRGLWFVQPGNVEWRETPDPVLQGPGEALVRPLAVARCDLDVAVVRGKAPVPGPFPIGHEFVAEVVETGDGVRVVSAGDRVVVPFQISCGECEWCRRGLTGSCTTVKRGSMYGLAPIGGEEWGGALADVVRVPFADAMLLPMPEAVPPHALAAVNDNVVDGYRTVGPQLTGDYAEGDVLVVGGGAPSIGLFAVAIARALGAGSVTYLDRSVERLAHAERLGAKAVEGPYPEKAGRFPITVDASSRPEGLTCAIRSTEPGGICTSVGIYFGDVTLPLLAMYTVGVTFVTGRPDSRALLPDAIELIASGKLEPQRLQTVVGWEAAPEAWTDPSLKLVVARDPAG